MQRDVERFKKWKKNSENFTLEDLRKSTHEWITHYMETYEKYKDYQLADKDYDRLFLTAKIGYFHYLANYSLNAMGAYVEKLRQEYDSLKKSKKKSGKQRKSRK